MAITVPGSASQTDFLDTIAKPSPSTVATASMLGVPVAAITNDWAEAEERKQQSSIAKQLGPATHRAVRPYELPPIEEAPLTASEYLLRGAGSLTGGAVRAVGQIPAGASRLFSVAHDASLELFLEPFKIASPELAEEVRTFLTTPIPYTPWWTNPEVGLEQLGDAIKEGADTLSPEDPTFIDEVLGGVGQLSAQIAIVLATGGTGGTAALFAQGADITGEKIDRAQRPDTTTVLLSGRKEEEPWEGLATVLGAGVTAVTEKYAIDRLLRYIPGHTRNRLVQILESAGTEGAQEILEEVGQNLVIMGFDPDAGSLAMQDAGLVRQGGVAAVVGGIAGAVLPRSGRRLRPGEGSVGAQQVSDPDPVETELSPESERGSRLSGAKRAAVAGAFVDQAHAKAKESPLPPSLGQEQRVESVLASGLDRVGIPVKALVEYGNNNLLSQLSTEIAEATNDGSDVVVLDGSKFATTIFGTKHYDALSDSLQFNQLPSRQELIDTVVANKEEIQSTIESDIETESQKAVPDTLYRRANAFVNKFVQEGDTDLTDVLKRAPDDVLRYVYQVADQVKQTELVNIEAQRTARLRDIKQERKETKTAIKAKTEEVATRKEQGKSTVRVEKQLAKLKEKDLKLSREQGRLRSKNKLTGKARYRVPATTPVRTTVQKLEELNVRANRRTVKEAEKAVREFGANIKRDIKEAQTVFERFLKKSSLDRKNQAKYLTAMRNIKGGEDLTTKLTGLRERILKDLERQRRAQLKGAIGKQVKHCLLYTSPSPRDS